ncbi:MAG TPA: hypothetical protein VF257_19395 [Solirubrobacteraceae bacterium]
MMQRLTRRVLQHKRLVAVTWILLTVVGIAAAGPATKALDQRFSVPGREGWEASQQILKLYGNGGETLPLVPVVTLPKGQTVSSPGVRQQLANIEVTAPAGPCRARALRASARRATRRSPPATGAPPSSTSSLRAATTPSVATSTSSARCAAPCAGRRWPARRCA